MDIRPRTTGEILDDAWRLYLADAPVLLALSSLFAAPAAVSVLLLLTLPRADDAPLPWLLPAVAAAALLATGLGAGACQEAFRLRAEGKPVTLRAGLVPALRRGLDHLAGRGLVWGITFLAASVPLLPAWAIAATILNSPLLADSFAAVLTQFLVLLFTCVVVPGIAGLAGGLALHPIVAHGELRWFAAWREAVRETQRHAGQAAAVALARPILGVIVAINLHLLLRIGLWIADDLAGFDCAVAAMVLTTRNPAYVAALVLFAWLLLAPYFEATSYLLHVDARARHEGLDLWYRVRRWFPAAPKQLVGCIALALAGLLHSPAAHADPRQDTVREVHRALVHIIDEVKTAEPYPGSARWEPALRELAQRLNDASDRPNGFRWFARGLDGFARADRASARSRLTDLERRLALLEESMPPDGEGKSKEEIKALLPASTSPKRSAPATEPKENKRPIDREDPLEPEPGPSRTGPGVVKPSAGRGLDQTAWLLLLGLFAAAVVVALVRARRRATVRAAPSSQASAPTELTLATLLQEADGAAGERLWRQADELARAGRWLDALRTLYLAVLALLHRADLIRFAPTRTNGEYLAQVRPRTGLYLPLESLTALFEQKFYGAKHCQLDDYTVGRRLAEQLREGIG